MEIEPFRLDSVVAKHRSDQHLVRGYYPVLRYGSNMCMEVRGTSRGFGLCPIAVDSWPTRAFTFSGSCAAAACQAANATHRTWATAE